MMRARILLLGLPLAACVNDSQPTYDGSYGFPQITGYSLAYRNGMAVEAFTTPKGMIDSYNTDIDGGLWGYMNFRIIGKSYTAYFKYIDGFSDHLYDTTVAGTLGRPDSAFINLTPARPCDTVVNGVRGKNYCFTHEDDALVINACVDMQFDSSNFDWSQVQPDHTPYWRHIRGVKCSETGPLDWPNRVRTDFKIRFPKGHEA